MYTPCRTSGPVTMMRMRDRRVIDHRENKQAERDHRRHGSRRGRSPACAPYRTYRCLAWLCKCRRRMAVLLRVQPPAPRAISHRCHLQHTPRNHDSHRGPLHAGTCIARPMLTDAGAVWKVKPLTLQQTPLLQRRSIQPSGTTLAAVQQKRGVGKDCAWKTAKPPAPPLPLWLLSLLPAPSQCESGLRVRQAATTDSRTATPPHACTPPPALTRNRNTCLSF
jgi:hypothetical protein